MAVTMQEQQKTDPASHSISLEGRKKLTATGVSNVDSYDDQTIVAYTGMGELTIRGKGLQINRLNVETGELTVDGEIGSMTYTDNQPHNAGIFAKLFR